MNRAANERSLRNAAERERIRNEHEAELLTQQAASALSSAAEAWDRLGIDSNRDDCYRARKLLPGQLP